MPRRARQVPGGFIYHVLNRAVARVPIFRAEKDRTAFELVLEEAHKRDPMRILAYCVMPNHWHLVLNPREDGELSRFMQWLTLTHVQRWRTSHNTVGYGPLYQGRFRSFAIQDDHHLLTVLRYVERNPVRAGLTADAGEWKWSSLCRRLNGSPEQQALLSPWPIDIPQNWRQFVNQPQTTAEEDAMKIAIQRSRPYGNPQWQITVAKRLGLTSCFRAPGRPWKISRASLQRK
jgi:putative transposase